MPRELRPQPHSGGVMGPSIEGLFCLLLAVFALVTLVVIGTFLMILSVR